MANSAMQATYDAPAQFNIQIEVGVPINGATVNVGDWLAYSGTSIFPTYAGHASTAYWKASGAGYAIESNPIYDAAGRAVQNTALRFVREGVIRATAAFSGVPSYGLGAYPVATGSAVAAPTGQTGVGATWQTGVKLPVSGGTGAGGSGIATVVGHRINGNGGTAELDLLLLPPRPDYY